MKLWIALLFISSLEAAESFITKEEYARGLYHNPRGVGCHSCHGEAGEGKMIAKYRDKGEQKAFIAKAINKLTFKEFYEKLNDRIVGMPRYYLTDNEIQTLYYYLHREEFKNGARKPRQNR